MDRQGAVSGPSSWIVCRTIVTERPYANLGNLITDRMGDIVGNLNMDPLLVILGTLILDRLAVINKNLIMDRLSAILGTTVGLSWGSAWTSQLGLAIGFVDIIGLDTEILVS